MRNLLIISPYWITANLVGTQRYRLLANHLEEYGWHPVILAVDPAHYPMTPVPELNRLVNDSVEVHYVRAFFKKGCRLGTDVSWRGAFQLYRKALELIREKPIDAIWVMIPSGIAPLLARLLHDRTGVPYGIDYTDPWVSPVKPRKKFSKVGLLHAFAPRLERFAVKNAAFLAGVSELSYLPVLERNPELQRTPCDAFPLGFDEHDDLADEAAVPPWKTSDTVWMFAGSIPPSFFPFWRFFFQELKQIREAPGFPENLRLFFFGTNGNMRQLAQEEGIAELVEERPRIPYLEVLSLLEQADGLLAIGSPEAHFTASKIFQLLYAGKMLFAVYHKDSTVNRILADCHADDYLVQFDPAEPEDLFRKRMRRTLEAFLRRQKAWEPDLSALNAYSARRIAGQFAALLERGVDCVGK